MGIESNKEAYQMVENTLRSLGNRFREAYNKGYKDGLRDGASQVTAKLVSKILEEAKADTPQTDCDKCIWNVCNYNKVEWDADTPQTDCETCKYGQDKHRYAHICNECGVGINNYTPQTDWHYDEQDATWYPYKHEDEPQQKSCATCKHALGNWDGESNNCGRCCGADRRFYEPKTESQTERSE